MRAHRLVSAGLTDAAVSSLATFVLGLYAARLDPAVVGAYALYFAALRLLQSIPNQLVFLPIEVGLLSVGERQRLAHFASSLRAGAPVALLAALLTAGTHLMLPSVIGWDVSGPLLITTTLATLISPVQDHVRRMLHLGGVPWAAALVSVVQLVFAVVAVVALPAMGVSAIWVPMGGLALANVTSMAAGLIVARYAADWRVAIEGFSVRELSQSGSWLLASSTIRNGAGLLAGFIIANLATVDDLGFAEAARVFSQPLLVLATGLGYAFRPGSLSAAEARDERKARRVSSLFTWLLAGAGAAAILIVGIPWSWSPFPDLLPNAYAIGGLLIVRLAANVVSGLAFPYRFEMQGARLEAKLAQTDTFSSIGQVLVAFTAPFTLAFASPLGILAVSLGQVFGYRSNLKPNYAKRSLGSGPPRVLHVAQGALGSGGGPYNLRSLARAQADLGLCVTVAGFTRSLDHVPDSVPYRTVELRRFRWPAEFRRLSREHDVVHVHGMLMWSHARFMAIARRSGASVFVTPRSSHHPGALRRRFDGRSSSPGWYLAKRVFAMLVDRPALQTARGIHVLSPFEASIEAASARSVLVHPYGIDPGPGLGPASVTDERLFLFVGRIDVYQKGLDILVEAFRLASVGSARLVIAGPGATDDLRLSGDSDIEFLGPVDRAKREELMGMADFFVHPSRWEVMARSAREALSQGLPLIASRESNFGDWVSSNNMGIVAELTIDGLTEAIEKAAMLEGAELQEMSRNALRFARSHTWATLAQATEAWYRESAQ